MSSSSISNNMSLESVSISSVMITDVKTAGENQSIQAACNILYKNKIGSVVITKNSTSENNESKVPVGIVTERDIVRLVSLPDNKRLVHEPVHLLMRSPLITINPNSSIVEAMQTMQQKDIRRLPVVDNKEKLLGIVTDKDIFRLILKNQSLLASSATSDQMLVDQQSIYGKFTDYWLRGIPTTP
jgi:CBS domain-containing protein